MELRACVTRPSPPSLGFCLRSLSDSLCSSPTTWLSAPDNFQTPSHRPLHMPLALPGMLTSSVSTGQLPLTSQISVRASLSQGSAPWPSWPAQSTPDPHTLLPLHLLPQGALTAPVNQHLFCHDLTDGLSSPPDCEVPSVRGPVCSHSLVSRPLAQYLTRGNSFTNNFPFSQQITTEHPWTDVSDYLYKVREGKKKPKT